MDLLEFTHPTNGYRFTVPVGKIVAIVETGAESTCDLLLADGMIWAVACSYEMALSKVETSYAQIRTNRTKAQ